MTLTTACTRSGGADAKSVGNESLNGAGKGQNAKPALSVWPGTNATQVSVADAVTVTAVSAVLDTVTLTDAENKQVPGEFDNGKRRWHSTQPLAFDSHYTITVAGTGSGGQRLTQTNPFTTVKPAKLATPVLRANNNMLLEERKTYGVGQPVVVSFDEPVTNRAEAENALQVTTEPRVTGAWRWISDREVHWRPPEYWKPGTKVSIKTNVYGRHLGDGLYGGKDTSGAFTVGPSKIAIADDKTFQMETFIDGKMVRKIPVAMGRHEQIGAIDLRTRSGPHVVLGNEQVTRMTSSSFGLGGAEAYDSMVEYTTHISYEGEYVHAAPWSVGQQGNSDASHGCININTENAIWFMENFGPGDVVDVRNTGLPLPLTDGLGDWTLSWADWIKGSATAR
ncbi:L,D-transpeptidase [Planosporangium mesophilum]|uniref:L,D-transpeptidase n=1 Tax=Planosporangium mesophilum TaxID=689768 RepID=UPI00143C1B76|nr:Ig-like domain-containing protein [Planosporangium mesophilum]NJC81915.1 L,D-transpeptidase [Planosporangium mesophilum]